MLTQHNLHYRGTDAKIKNSFKKLTTIQNQKFENQANHSYSDEPLKDAKIFYAYGINPNDSMVKSIKQSIAQPITALQKTFQQFTLEEQNFIKIIADNTKQHYLAQFIMSLFNITPPVYALLAILLQASMTSGQLTEDKLYQFIFKDGLPLNGTDLCYQTTASQCEQFYVNYENETVVQGASYLTTTRHSLEDVLRTTKSCGDKNQLITLLQDIVGINNVTALGNQTCFTSVYSPEKTIHRDNELVGVSSAVCEKLQNNSDSVLQSCINKAARALDFESSKTNKPALSNESSSEMYLFFTVIWIPLIMVIFMNVTIRIAKCSHSKPPVPTGNAASHASLENPSENASQKTSPNLADHSLFAASNESVVIDVPQTEEKHEAIELTTVCSPKQ